MKKFLMSVGILFLGMVLLSACKDAEAELDPTTFETVNNLTGLSSTIVEDTLTKTGAIINYNNQTENELTYGEAYVLEKSMDGIWYQVPYLDEDGVAFIEIAYILSPRSTSEWQADWQNIYGPLEPGVYRLVKDFLLVQEPGDYDTYHSAAEFIIE